MDAGLYCASLSIEQLSALGVLAGRADWVAFWDLLESQRVELSGHSAHAVRAFEMVVDWMASELQVSLPFARQFDWSWPPRGLGNMHSMGISLLACLGQSEGHTLSKTVQKRKRRWPRSFQPEGIVEAYGLGFPDAVGEIAAALSLVERLASLAAAGTDRYVVLLAT